MRKLLNIITGLATLWLIGFVLFSSYAVTATTPDITKLSPEKGIIVPTGGKDRIETGHQILAHFPDSKMLITGVYPKTTLNDLISDPSLANRITLDYTANNTHQNARSAAQWLQDQSITRYYLVTSSYHMLRAYLLFKREIPMADSVMIPVQSDLFTSQNSWQSKKLWITLFKSYNKLLVTLPLLLISET